MSTLGGRRGKGRNSGRGGRCEGGAQRAFALVWALLVAAAFQVSAQSLADRVAQVREGHVRFSFEPRPGVCGNGRNSSTGRRTADWEPWCEPGPVRVAVELRNGQPVDLDTYVGGRWRAREDPVTDVGDVEPIDAVAYLVSLAQGGAGRVAERAVLPIALADLETWPQLLELAKDGSRPRAVRRSAVFWLGQAAGDAAVEGLASLVAEQDEDVEVKKSAIFALSRLRNGGGVEPLIRIARSNRDPRLRKQAIFWLGQSDDPRAIALFEELLTKR